MPYTFNENEIENQIKEDQLKRLIPEGVRILTVVGCEQRPSEYGGFFLLDVKDKEANKETKVFLGLSAGNHKTFKESCMCFGMMDKYDLGSVDALDFVGKVGPCKIVHEEKKGFGLQSKVEKFMDPEEAPITDDDIPF